jgi:hypothetical protein
MISAMTSAAGEIPDLGESHHRDATRFVRADAVSAAITDVGVANIGNSQIAARFRHDRSVRGVR